MKVIRYPFKEKYLFFFNEGKIKKVNSSIFLKKYKVLGIIKFTKQEFKNIKKGTKCLRHYNIQYCGHKKNNFYMLVKIIEKGSFDGKVFKSPVLDQNIKILAKCTLVKNFVNYDRLKNEDFKNYIIKRYDKSLSYLSIKEKLSIGVSITDLKLI
jgi:hypothetical protein